MPTADYRRPKGDDTKPWHFCANCKAWPKENYVSSERPVRPVCDQCLALQKRQMCTRADAYI